MPVDEHTYGPGRWNPVTIVLLLLLIVGIYAGVKFIPHYYRNMKLVSAWERIGEIAPKAEYPSAEAFEEHLYKEALAAVRAVGIEATDIEISIDTIKRDMEINGTYTVTVSHPGLRSTVLTMTPSARFPTGYMIFLNEED